MSLKKRFENYTEQPDPKVWQSVNSTLRRKTVIRRSLTAGGIAIVATVAVIGFSHKTESVMVQQVVAEQMQAPATPETIITTNTMTQHEVEKNATEQKAIPATNPTTFLSPTTTETDFTTMVSDATPTPKAVETDIQQQTVTAKTPVEKHEALAITHNDETSTVPDNAASPAPTSKTLNIINDTLSSDFINFKSFIPTAISPDNGTGAGVFRVNPKVRDYMTVDQFKMYIYNRGGRMVFHSTSLDEGWNGISNGSKQPYGSYVYIIEYRDGDGQIQRVQGSFILVR